MNNIASPERILATDPPEMSDQPDWDTTLVAKQEPDQLSDLSLKKLNRLPQIVLLVLRGDESLAADFINGRQRMFHIAGPLRRISDF